MAAARPGRGHAQHVQWTPHRMLAQAIRTHASRARRPAAAPAKAFKRAAPRPAQSALSARWATAAHWRDAAGRAAIGFGVCALAKSCLRYTQQRRAVDHRGATAYVAHVRMDAPAPCLRHSPNPQPTLGLKRALHGDVGNANLLVRLPQRLVAQARVKAL